MEPVSIHAFISAAYRSRGPDERLIVDEKSVLTEAELPADQIDISANERTWQVFQEAIKKVLSPGRVERISSRYQICPEQMKQFPFLARYVSLFGIGAGHIHCSDLTPPAGTEIRDAPPHQIEKFWRGADPIRYRGPPQPRRDISGGPGRPHEYFKTSPLERDRKLTLLSEGVAGMNWPAYMQRLTMAITGCEPEEGVVIPAPSTAFPGKIDFYVVHRVIEGEGLQAFALKPVSLYSGLSPLLVFRPTRTSLSDKDFFHSLRNNAHEQIGQLGYEATKDQLQQLMEDPSFRLPNQKIIVGGFSLGDAHAGFFFHDHIQQVKDIYSFNGVFNSGDLAKKIADKINRLPSDIYGPAIHVYRATADKKGDSRDWATCVGDYHYGFGIRHPRTFVEVQDFYISELSPISSLSDWLIIHSFRYLDGEFDPYEKYHVTSYRGAYLVDRQLNNVHRSEEIRKFELLRRSLGTQILYHFLTIFHRILDFGLRYLGIPLLRSSS